MQTGQIHLQTDVLPAINCVFLSRNLVSWQSQQQSIVAWSFAEAEYTAMANIAAEF
jgi:hypothetical protein